MRTLGVVLTLASSMIFTESSAQWVQTGGPYSPHHASVLCMASSSNALFVGTGLGVYRSTNNGSTWTLEDAGLPEFDGVVWVYSVSTLAVIGPRLYAQARELMVSDIDQLQWTNANAPFVLHQVLEVGSNFLAATDRGVFVSSDEGTTWTAASGALGKIWVSEFAVHQQNLFAGDLARGVFRSTDSGTNWTQVNSGLTDTSITHLVVSNTNVVAGTERGIFFSTNDGTNWNPAKSSPADVSIKALAVGGSNVFASTSEGVLISTDNGASWSPANTPFSRFTQMLQSGTTLFVTAGADFMRSTNDGRTWTPSDTGISCAGIGSLASIGNYLVASAGSEGCFRSSDCGTSWEMLNPGVSNCEIGGLYVDGTNLYALSSRGVLRSSDYGSNWIQLNAGLSDTLVGQLAVDGEFMFAGTGSGLFRSSDKGTSWSLLKKCRVSALAANGAVLYLGYFDGFVTGYGTLGGVMVSTNYGETWNVDPDMWDPIEFFVASGPNVYASNKSGLSLSWDTGATWVPVDRGLGSTRASALIVLDDRVFASSGGIYLSTDDGTSWTNVSEDPPNGPTGGHLVSAYCFAANDTYLFGESPLGVIRRPLAEMTGPPYPNLLRNSGFEKGTAYWNFYTDGSGEFTNNARGDRSPHAGVIELTSPGTNVQLYQSGIHLKAATRYKLTFKTYSNSGHTFKVFLHKHGAPYTSYGLDGWEVDIGGQNYLHETEFTTENFSDSVDDARLRFWFAPYATAGDRYWIDDVVLQESPDSNLIVNGGFESGTDPWKFYTNGESVLSLGSQDRPQVWGYHPSMFALARITTSGTNTQLYQKGIQLQAGTRYSLSFWARICNGAVLGVYIHKHEPPYTLYGLEVPDVTSLGGGYSYNLEFMAGNFSGIANDARLRFCLASSPPGSEVWIDDVVLKPINTPAQSMSKASRVNPMDLAPTEFALSQNYPNPFNPTTVVSCQWPVASVVRLVVYDVLGRQVAVLADGRYPAGKYSFTFDAHGLASGVYFYRLTAGTAVATRSMILVK